MKIIYFVALFFLATVSNVSAQKRKTNKDSLFKVWNSKAEQDTNRLKALSDIIFLYTTTDLDTASQLCFQQLAFARKKNEKRWIGNAYNSLCMVYKNKGDYALALNYGDTALAIHSEINNRKGIASILNTMSNVYRRQGNLTKALDYNLKSLKIKEELKDSAGIATSLGNIAIVYTILYEYDKALEFHFKSLKIREKSGNKMDLANSFSNIGALYFKQDNFKEGLNYQMKALKLEEEIGNITGVATDLANMGLNYKGMKDYANALICFEKALAINEKTNNKASMSHVYGNIGSLYLDEKKYADAILYLEKSLKLADELGELETQEDDNLKLYKCYKQMGNGTAALTYYEKTIRLKDSIYKEENQKQIYQRQIQYDYDKKATADSVKVAEEKKVTTAELEKEKTQRLALYGGLLLVIVFSIFIFNRFRITQKQKQVIELKNQETEAQKAIIEEHQKETIDSINYAKRIQYALLANENLLKQNLPEHFLIFSPKDIVSGDFYWATEHNNKFYLAVCDSTGHGVPGAFMSLLNIGFLSEAIKEKNILEPNEVFNYVRKRLIDSIGKDDQDGMDAILICIDTAIPGTTKTITYVAANNVPVLVKGKEIIELPKDRMPVGKGEKKESFTLQTVTVQKGDVLYLYTDGYADQFGGPDGKKFKYRKLNELLLSIYNEDMDKQKTVLSDTFYDWKGDHEQIDDVCLVGIKF